MRRSRVPFYATWNGLAAPVSLEWSRVMRRLAIVILVTSCLMPAHETGTLYLIAIDGTYSVVVDNVTKKIQVKHFIKQEITAGTRHTMGYQIGYFGDWTATSFKAIAGQSYYFVFGSASGRGRTVYQLSSTQGELCLRALENRNGTQPCLMRDVNGLYSFPQSFTPRNLVPWGLHTNAPR